MTNRSDRIKAHLNAQKISEDAAGDVLRATVAKHKLKDMEGKKKSPALIAKLTKRVAAGKRHMTEEAIKKAVKPAPKPTKILTNNPGYGYHGIADAKHKGDTNKAHAEYNRMHVRVKDWAGEAGHLMHAKKPNLMVRDYLDSSRGRHLEGLQADEKYIKKDFGHFARSYDPKLFVESLEEGKATHGVFTVWHSGDYKGMVIHHGGNSSNVARVEALAAKLNGQVEDFNKRSEEKSNYHHEVRPLGKKTVSEERMEQHAGFKPGDIVTHEDSAPMHIHTINLFPGSKEPQALLGYKPSGKGRGIRHAFVSSLRHHKVNEGTLNEGIGVWAVDKLTDYSVNKGKKDHRPDIIKDQSEKLRSEGLKHVTARYDQDHMYHKKAIDAWHAVVDHAAKAKTIGEFQKRAKNIGDAHETLINHDGPHSPLRPIKEEILTETSKSQDAQRVQYGVMKRDDYLRKWKIGKFGPKQNSLAGPGGLYKNLLVGSNIDNKSASTKK